MTVPVTILYGTLSILITAMLGLFVSLYRAKNRVLVADPPPPTLFRLIRAHGNSTEWLAVTTFLIFFLEIQGAPSLPLHVFGGGVVLTRIGHSFFMITKSILTTLTATLTYILVFLMCGWALYLRFR